MRYALVKDAKVVNVVIAESDFINQLSGYDHKVQLNDNQAVSIGYNYDGANFSAPSPTLDLVQIVKSARRFAQDLMDSFAAENIELGITQAGKTAQVRIAMANVINACQTGSLYDAIAQAKAIPAENKDATFVTDARILAFINAIEDYLGAPRSTSL